MFELTTKEKRECARMRICHLLLNRTPSEYTGDFASRLIGVLETEFNYRIVSHKEANAPELYEALKNLIERIDNGVALGEKLDVEPARKALAHAEGVN
jgi:hypothetical protein